MNFYELQARLDPQYQSKMGMLREKVHAQYEIEQYRANQNMQAEQYRADRQMDIARFQANEAAQREQARASEYRDAERIKGENRIQEMELDLDHRMRLIGADGAALATQKEIDEGIAKRRHLMDQMAERSKLRGDIFKMIAGAAIQEKLAQKQHARDMEKMKLEATLRRADGYMNSLTAYLSQLVESGQEAKVKSEIDRLTTEWQTAAKISDEIGAFKKENGL